MSEEQTTVDSQPSIQNQLPETVYVRLTERELNRVMEFTKRGGIVRVEPRIEGPRFPFRQAAVLYLVRISIQERRQPKKKGGEIVKVPITERIRLLSASDYRIKDEEDPRWLELIAQFTVASEFVGHLVREINKTIDNRMAETDAKEYLKSIGVNVDDGNDGGEPGTVEEPAGDAGSDAVPAAEGDSAATPA